MRLNPFLIRAVAALMLGLGLYLWGLSSGVKALRPRLSEAEAVARAAGLSAQEARESADRRVAQARTADAASTVSAEIAADLSHSETAHAPLDPDRRDRLRRADQRLCQLAPQLGGCRGAD